MTAESWRPDIELEMLPGRSVHDWDRILRRLYRIGVPGLLVFIGLAGSMVALSQFDGLRYGPWIWWVAGIVGLPSWLAGGVMIVGGRMVLPLRANCADSERALGYSTAKYEPNFMVTPPEVDYVDSETGRVVKLAREPWLTEHEYSDRLSQIRASYGDPSVHRRGR